MALAATLAVLAAGVHSDGCNSADCVERVAARWCTQTRVVSCIHRAALRYDVGYAMLRARAWCESRLLPYARNAQSGAMGLYQFLPSTWARTPYARRSPWRAKWSALAAAWMEHMGRGGEWACR